jgi:hypothetical protein
MKAMRTKVERRSNVGDKDQRLPDTACASLMIIVRQIEASAENIALDTAGTTAGCRRMRWQISLLTM